MKNVLFPSNNLSDAPKRQNILSNGFRTKLLAGLLQPNWAKIILTATILNKVDFPLILGPVSNKTSLVKSIVLLIHYVEWSLIKHGWKASTNLNDSS